MIFQRTKKITTLFSVFVAVGATSCGKFFHRNTERPTTSLVAPQFNSVVTFGDSLSDNGNLQFATSRPLYPFGLGHSIPVDPYYRGRFSDGPVWVEDLMDDLMLNPESATNCFLNIYVNHSCDYAVGGATTSQNITSDKDPFKEIKDFFKSEAINKYLSGIALPMHLGVKQMAQAYLSKVNPDGYALNHTLYVVWAGANDYFARSDTSATVSNIVSIIKSILDKNKNGEKRYILVPNLPNLGETPFGRRRTDLKEELIKKSSEHNKMLADAINDLVENHDYKETAVILQLDVAGLFNQISKNNGVLHDKAIFKNVVDACYSKNYMDSSGVICDKRDEFLFWDEVHPSAKAHQLLNLFAQKQLFKAGLMQQNPLDLFGFKFFESILKPLKDKESSL